MGAFLKNRPQTPEKLYCIGRGVKTRKKLSQQIRFSGFVDR